MTNEQLNRRDAARISVQNRIMKTVDPMVDLSTAKFEDKLYDWVVEGRPSNVFDIVSRELRDLPGMLSMTPAVKDLLKEMSLGRLHGDLPYSGGTALILTAVRILSDHEQLAF